MTSGMAHDFANLLTIILGMQSRLSRLVDHPEAEPLITATLQAARRGGDLLNRIADITSHRVWRPEPVELSGFLDGLKTLASPTLPDGVVLETLCEAGGGHLIDPGLLQDAMLNLILNAADACGAQGRITVAARPLKDTWLEITVSDTGPGFGPEALKHALDPFFTTKGDKGTGLGLAMVYDMVKLAGGAVRIGNGASGARVVLRLPLRPVGALPQTGLVLLVEDNADLRTQIRDMLTAMGFSVAEAASVDEARALADGLDIALVLSDIVLEGEGYGTALPPELAPLPVFLMTSLPPDHPLHAEARSLAPVLAKPFDAAALSAFLGRGRSAA